MYVEAFTQAKDPAAPRTNEDRWLAHESRLFAVIDGVTDKSGAPLPDGATRGQAAGRLLEERLRELAAAGPLPADTGAVVTALTDAIASAYARFGIAEAVMDAPHLRFGAQLVAALATPAGWRLLSVGDCGARVRRRGAPPLVIGAPGHHDDIVAIWRALVVGHLLRRTGEGEALAVGREYALVGNARYLPEHGSLLDQDDHARLAAEAAAEARAAHPELSGADVDTVLHAGILGLGRYRNARPPLGFACLDGTAVPLGGVRDLTFASAEVESIELYSDGYFGPPPGDGASVADWERHFRQVEATDPHKIGLHRSTKGSSGGKLTDDRTVLIVKPEAGE